jgi:hypothetical protein
MKWKWNVPMDTDVSREANRQSGSDSWRGCALLLLFKRRTRDNRPDL